MTTNRTATLLSLTIIGASAALAAPPKTPALPKVNGVEAVASVNGEPISLAELERQLALIHMQAGEGTPAKQDPTALLDRLINAKLIAQEAREAGFDEDPAFRAEIEKAERGIARDMLIERQTRDLKPDPALVESAYKEMVRVHRIGSIFFSEEKSAREFESGIQAGRDFFELSREMRGAGKATGPDGPVERKESELLPSVAKLLTLIKPGETGPIMQSPREWAFIHYASVSYPDNPEARTAAREKALESKREQKIEQYAAALRAQYATIDRKLLDSLDYEKEGEAAKLAQDTRAVAQIKGDAPITVAELTAGMNRRFFHGVENAVRDKKKSVNKEKQPVLEDVINRRVIPLEGRRVGLPATPEYKARLARSEEQLLFETYVQRALLPEVKVTDADLEAYYAKHQKEYTTPEMVQLEAIGFGTRAQAEDAFAKLQKGADWKWVEANAAGRLSAADEAAEFALPKGPIVVSALPEAARKSVQGARGGDIRFYEASASGPFFVLAVRDRRAPETPKLDAVKSNVSAKVRAEKVSKVVEDTAAALRRASDVKIYATGEELRRILVRELGRAA